MNPIDRRHLLTLTVAAAAVITVVSAGLAPALTTASGNASRTQTWMLAAAAEAHRDDMKAAAHADELALRDSSASQPAAPPPQVRIPAPLREPIALSIPDLGIESEIVPTSIDEARNIVVPEDVLLTGWYDESRRLGAVQGSTVIVGHRDSASQGTGALYAIEEIPVGSSITVTSRDGTQHDFTVDSVELLDKALLPAEAPRVFTRQGPYRLVLITCGGAFDAAAGSYLSNVIVTATPAPA